MLPASLALLPSIFQFGQSIAQRNKANNLQQSNYIPPSVQNAVANARLNAGATEAPGQDQALSRIRTSTANSILNAKKTASNAAQLSSSVGESEGREKQDLQGLTANNQAFQFRNRQDLMKWLGIRGEYEQSNYDKFNAAKSALIGASNQNAFNALTGAATTGLVALDKGAGLDGYTLGGQPTSQKVLGAAGMPKNVVLGAGGNNSILGKTGLDLQKALKSRNGAGLDENEQAYLESMGYSISPSGEVLDMESPNLQVFAQ